MNRQIVFLTYLSRSGSTLLARLLDGYMEAGVCLEADFPDGLTYNPLTRDKPLRVETREERDRLLERLYAGAKFQAWGIDRARAEAAFSRLPLPFGLEELFACLAELSFPSGERVVVFKHGDYFKRLDLLHEAMPEAKFIFILRDLRAMYASQKRSLASRTGRPISENPLDTARHFRWACSAIGKYKDRNWFHYLKYEDLVSNTDQEMNKILAFIGLGADAAMKDSDYYERISEEQKHLHLSVSRPPDKERIAAWKQELSAAEIAVLELAAGGTLAQFGYERLNPAIFSVTAIIEGADLVFRYLKHAAYWGGCWLLSLIRRDGGNLLKSKR